VRKHLHQVLTGERLSPFINSQRYFHPLKLLRIRSYVIKFVTANMMLPWLCDEFDVQAVFMVRHPCAVVSSQMVHGAWAEIDKSFCKHDRLFEDYPHLQPVFERLDGQEEILAFNWAIQNLVPLKAPAPRPWVETTYERLVETGREEVDRIYAELGWDETPPQAYAYLRTPSATTVSESNVAKGNDPLVGWRKRLTTKQIDRILSVTHDVGLDVYTDDLRPVSSRLEH
jgi:hypothetical protein